MYVCLSDLCFSTPLNGSPLQIWWENCTGHDTVHGQFILCVQLCALIYLWADSLQIWREYNMSRHRLQGLFTLKTWFLVFLKHKT
jgi:hypothetical protein